ncbi:hypothetical protein FO519_009991, partial [Halicephalobus sp. NKZ332]
IRTDCLCNNPLRRSDTFSYIYSRNCSLEEAISCSDTAFSSGNSLEVQRLRREICPDPCFSKSYSIIVSTVRAKDDFFVGSENDSMIDAMLKSQLNKVVNFLDKTKTPFFGKRHSMWTSVEFLEPMMDEYLNFLNSLIQIAFKNQTLLDRVVNLDPRNFFDNYVPQKPNLDLLIENYFGFSKNISIQKSRWDTITGNETSVQARSFDLQIILGKIQNPVALVNFYLSQNFLNLTIEAFDNFRKNLETCLEDPALETKIEILKKLRNSEILKQPDSVSVKSNLFFRNLSMYIDQYKGLNDTDVGGMMGLYFGLTMVTFYEMITFAFIDREPPESHTKKEMKLTRKFLYPKVCLEDEPIPSIF